MRVVGAGVDLELGQLLASQPVAGEHPLHGDPDDLLGTPLEHVVERARLEAAGIAAVAGGELVGALVPPHRDLLGGGHDDEVARVAVRGGGGVGLSAPGGGVCAGGEGRRRSAWRAGGASARWRPRSASRAGGRKVWLRRSSRREKCHASTMLRAAGQKDREPRVLSPSRRMWVYGARHLK